MPTPAKKSAPKRVAATRHPNEDAIRYANEDEPKVDVATDLALDWLMREAFRSGRWAHARVIIEDSTLPDEVKAVLLKSYGRASS